MAFITGTYKLIPVCIDVVLVTINFIIVFLEKNKQETLFTVLENRISLV